MKCVSVEVRGNGPDNCWITIVRGWWRQRKEVYRGDLRGTVWHRYPDGRRATTSMEIWLCDLSTAASWENHP